MGCTASTPPPPTWAARYTTHKWLGSSEPRLLNGKGVAAAFNSPSSVVMNRTCSRLFISDGRNHCIRMVNMNDGIPSPPQISHLTSFVDVTDMVTVFAGDGTPGDVDGDGAEAKFECPHELRMTPEGDLMVAQCANYVVRHITAASEGVLDEMKAVAPLAHFPPGLLPLIMTYFPKSGLVTTVSEDTCIRDRSIVMSRTREVLGIRETDLLHVSGDSVFSTCVSLICVFGLGATRNSAVQSLYGCSRPRWHNVDVTVHPTTTTLTYNIDLNCLALDHVRGYAIIAVSSWHFIARIHQTCLSVFMRS